MIKALDVGARKHTATSSGPDETDFADWLDVHVGDQFLIGKDREVRKIFGQHFRASRPHICRGENGL
jgi:hypothetical protein